MKKFWRVFNLDNPFCNPCVLVRPDNSGLPVDISKDILSLEVFPNPSADYVNLSFEILTSGEVKILGYDQEGRVNVFDSKYLDKGNYVYHLKVNDGNSGIQYYSVKMNGQALTKSIINRK